MECQGILKQPPAADWQSTRGVTAHTRPVPRLCASFPACSSTLQTTTALLLSMLSPSFKVVKLSWHAYLAAPLQTLRVLRCPHPLPSLCHAMLALVACWDNRKAAQSERGLWIPALVFCAARWLLCPHSLPSAEPQGQGLCSSTPGHPRTAETHQSAGQNREGYATRVRGAHRLRRTKQGQADTLATRGPALAHHL